MFLDCLNPRLILFAARNMMIIISIKVEVRVELYKHVSNTGTEIRYAHGIQIANIVCGGSFQG